MGTLVTGAPDNWAAGVRRVSDEAAGLVALQVVMPEDVPELFGHALAGDSEAARLVGLVSQALRRIQEAPRDRAMLCGTCPKRLRGGRFAIVCAIPHRDDPREALTLGICRRCAVRHEDIVRTAGQALRRVWPDLRPLPGPIHPHAGRA